MITYLYSTKDRLSEYAPPIPFRSEEESLRYFYQICNTNQMIKDNPEDFTWWFLGAFDTELGTVMGEKEPQLTEKAINVTKKE